MLEEVFRDQWGRVLASLAGFLGDLDRAEEAAQEAFAVAAARWPETGVPDNPGAWLVTTGRNRAIDRIRRERTLAGKLHLLTAPEAVMDEVDDTAIGDERLELIFTCCHPALALEAQVALTLRALGGLETAEIARAFLVSEETMKRRLTRAKAKIRAAGIPFAVPGERLLPDRLDAVLAIVYLVYNEGYSGRVDLGAEAIRLGRVLAGLLADRPEPHGLLALMLIHQARQPARFDGDDLVLLADQDRSRWDRSLLAAGRAALDRAIALGGRGPYVLQAAIASLQTRERVDWSRVAGLYRRLAELTGSPVVELNRAVAVAQAGDPAAALGAVDSLDLDGYPYFHSTRGELLRRLGRDAEAGTAYRRALGLAVTTPERRFLTRRLEELRAGLFPERRLVRRPGMSDVSTLVVDGELIRPADDAYDTHRHAYQRHGSPALIVRARSVDDVRRALAAAREHDLLLSVRSGGHGGPGFATNDGGLVLDLGPLDGVEVLDPDRRLVRIGAGARWAGVTAALAPYGWAISSGDTTEVGVGGLILGGGIGWMARRFGLTIDSVVAAEVVTADGRVLRAGAAEHPDLFWALRGGGGNFGVVTAFDVVAQPVPEVYFGHVAYPRADAAAVLRGWRDAMRAAPDELTSTMVLLPDGFAPHSLVVGVCLAHGDAAAAEDVVEPLLRLGDATVLDLRVRPYGDILAPPPPAPTGMPPLAKNRLTADLGDELIDAYLAGLAGGPPVIGQVRSLGGAVARVAGTETAFAHRDSEAMLAAVALSPAREAFDAYWATLAPYTRGAYGNLMSSLDPADIAELYPPETRRRLVEVKRAYDPENLFRQTYPV